MALGLQKVSAPSGNWNEHMSPEPLRLTLTTKPCNRVTYSKNGYINAIFLQINSSAIYLQINTSSLPNACQNTYHNMCLKIEFNMYWKNMDVSSQIHTKTYQNMYQFASLGWKTVCCTEIKRRLHWTCAEKIHANDAINRCEPLAVVCLGFASCQ